MSKPEWTKISSGPVECCVGTDGVTGVWTGTSCYAVTPDGGIGWCGDKDAFEHEHCQPPAPRHIRKDYADGSFVIESVEQDEQGRPLRVAFVRKGIAVSWVIDWCGDWEEKSEKQNAIDRAIRYVETGE